MNTHHDADRLPFAADVYRGTEADARMSAIDALRAELRSEIRSIRNMMARPATPPALAAELGAIRAMLDQNTPAPKSGKAASMLRARGIDGPLAAKIAAAMRASKSADAEEAFADAIAEIVPIAPWKDPDGAPALISVVGSAGVGKTTTLAKLATRARLAGKKVSMICCDGFRVGAVEQLERYGELIGAAVHVARSAAELDAVLRRETAQVVFVDTSGRPPTSSSPEAAVAGATGYDRTVLLCVAASTRMADAARAATVYAPLGITATCVTKTDETSTPAALIAAPFAARAPLSVICTGPRVPEDLSIASLSEVVTRLAGDTKKVRSAK